MARHIIHVVGIARVPFAFCPIYAALLPSHTAPNNVYVLGFSPLVPLYMFLASHLPPLYRPLNVIKCEIE
jgi:hypothetical protein